jgi:hypothetical protein
VSKIKVVSKCAIYDGISITFKAPCNSNTVDGINVYHNGAKTTFTLRDAHGANVANKSNLFTTGAYVKVVLDTTNKYAYLQNADTNAYLEENFGVNADAANALGLNETATVDEALVALKELINTSIIGAIEGSY